MKNNAPLNFLSCNTFHSEKTSRDYYNVNLFDDSTGDSFTCNTDLVTYQKLIGSDSLVSCDCVFEYDSLYNRLYLKDITIL